MSFFTTRVELHKSLTEKDYETLHSEMEKVGFWRYIGIKNHPFYHLPTAEYNYYSDTLTAKEVLELAKNAASRTKLKFMVLVTKADGNREWYNLDEKQ